MSGSHPWSKKWLIRSLVAGVVFLAIWLVALFGPPFPQSALLEAPATACLSGCLVVAAVSFVFEVVRRVTGVLRRTFVPFAPLGRTA